MVSAENKCGNDSFMFFAPVWWLHPVTLLCFEPDHPMSDSKPYTLIASSVS